MVNRLKLAKITSILTLHEQGWSARRIARELGVDRKTAGRSTRGRDSKPAVAPSGIDEEAQVDFGRGAPLILPDGKRRKI